MTDKKTAAPAAKTETAPATATAPSTAPEATPAAPETEAEDEALTGDTLGQFNVTNNQVGPRGFSNSDGIEVMLDPKGSSTVTLTNDAAERLKSFGFKVTAAKA